MGYVDLKGISVILNKEGSKNVEQIPVERNGDESGKGVFQLASASPDPPMLVRAGYADATHPQCSMTLSVGWFVRTCFSIDESVLVDGRGSAQLPEPIPCPSVDIVSC